MFSSVLGLKRLPPDWHFFASTVDQHIKETAKTASLEIFFLGYHGHSKSVLLILKCGHFHYKQCSK